MTLIVTTLLLATVVGLVVIAFTEPKTDGPMARGQRFHARLRVCAWKAGRGAALFLWGIFQVVNIFSSEICDALAAFERHAEDVAVDQTLAIARATELEKVKA